jgi:hypothetical protein
MTVGTPGTRLASTAVPATAERSLRDEGSRTMGTEHDPTDRRHEAAIA